MIISNCYIKHSYRKKQEPIKFFNKSIYHRTGEYSVFLRKKLYKWSRHSLAARGLKSLIKKSIFNFKKLDRDHL